MTTQDLFESSKLIAQSAETSAALMVGRLLQNIQNACASIDSLTKEKQILEAENAQLKAKIELLEPKQARKRRA